MTHCRLGDFCLQFDPSGKLSDLTVSDDVTLLHRSEYDLPLGDGRVFEVGGWDECFPTIEPAMGELVAAPPVLRHAGDEVEQVWSTARYRVTRTFRSLEKRKLEVVFRAENTGTPALEFLWASHALFSLDGVQRIALTKTQVLTDFELNGTCLKYFVPVAGPVRLERDDMILALMTDQPFWGIWLNRGGWPAKQPASFRCIGIEATSTAAESPDGRKLQPGEEFWGHINLEIVS